MNYLQKHNNERHLLEICQSPRELRGFTPNNTDEHEVTKLLIALKLERQGFSVYPECEFKYGKGRADLVAIQNGVGYIIEVLNSEKDADCDEKVTKYPSDFTVTKVNVNDFNKDEWTL